MSERGRIFKKEILPVKECRGRDLNSRTSTGQGPQPCAVGQAWLPLHGVCVLSGIEDMLFMLSVGWPRYRQGLFLQVH